LSFVEQLIVVVVIRAYSVPQLIGILTLNEPIAAVVQTLLLRDWTEDALFR
jgi:hypothetical protein